MKHNRSSIRYILYARKSSEGEDRQVQSIEDQLTRLRELAQREMLSIVKIIAESKSAKKPDNRPGFNEVIRLIETGKADGILCWQINRLSRNPVDSGTIQYLLQQEVIKSIQTNEREYLPDDNALILSVETGMANQFIRDLKMNMMRGVKGKLERGGLPNMAPLGYLNERYEKTVIIDPERYDLVRKMWDLLLSEAYTVPQILEETFKWGLTTVKYRKIGGKPLSRSSIYKLFTNKFYAGVISYDGQEYQGAHKPMITLEEYDRAQRILGRRGKPRTSRHEYPYTGLIRCGDCGCLITAETKHKRLKNSGKIKSYIYYHCTRRKVGYNCSQHKHISEENLEELLANEISKYAIFPEFEEWAFEVLEENHEKEVVEREAIRSNQQKEIDEIQGQLDNLVRMRYREQIDDTFFEAEKKSLTKRMNDLKQGREETEDRATRWLKTADEAITFATYARNAFEQGDLHAKKSVLIALGSNFRIRDGILSLETNELLVEIKKNDPTLEADYLTTLELTKNDSPSRREEALLPIKQRWLLGSDSNRQPAD